MHCDDKRMLFVLKGEIQKSWERLDESNFDQGRLEDFSDALTQYFELEQSLQSSSTNVD